jgi:hypothetical protein
MPASPSRHVGFRRIANAALERADAIVMRWLPEGRREGAEWVAINPTRVDHRKGSFKINLRTGAWADFATNHRGGDLISLAAVLFQISQREAALRLAEMIGVDPYDG